LRVYSCTPRLPKNLNWFLRPGPKCSATQSSEHLKRYAGAGLQGGATELPDERQINGRHMIASDA
jgi:hypothetical protein